jgi:hypothetical protein
MWCIRLRSKRSSNKLGIDANKEGEIFDCGPVEDGFLLYGGWFYLVGEMVTWGERNSKAEDNFEFWFTSIGAGGSEFRGGPRLTLEFSARVRWVLPQIPAIGRNPQVSG